MGFSVLSQLSKLATVNLGDQRDQNGNNRTLDLQHLVDQIDALENLTSLNLRDNDLSSVGPLVVLTNLTSLNLSWNWSISDASPLAALTQLIYLNLSGNNQVQLGDL